MIGDVAVEEVLKNSITAGGAGGGMVKIASFVNKRPVTLPLLYVIDATFITSVPTSSVAFAVFAVETQAVATIAMVPILCLIVVVTVHIRSLKNPNEKGGKTACHTVCHDRP